MNVNTVEELKHKLELIRNLGYTVRYDWFGGTGGGACQIENQKYLFLDLALGAIDHLLTADQLLNRQQLTEITDRDPSETSQSAPDSRAA